MTQPASATYLGIPGTSHPENYILEQCKKLKNLQLPYTYKSMYQYYPQMQWRVKKMDLQNEMGRLEER